MRVTLRHAFRYRGLERILISMTASYCGYVLDSRYRLDEQIGAGGMGTIYRATCLDDGSTCAVKVLGAADGIDSDARRRFTREASNALRIRHPHAVRTFAVGERSDMAWMAMELLPGRTLNELITQEGRSDPKVAAAWIQQLAGVLDAVHAMGIVHRDVKPANVMLTGRGVDAHLRLLDFGLARDVGNVAHAITRDGKAAGTPGFMAPEQRYGGPPDGRADVFSLAALAAYLLVGRMPVASWALPLTTRMFGRIRRWPDEVDLVLTAALDPDPALRTRTAGDFADAFSTAVTAPGWVTRSPVVQFKRDGILDEIDQGL